MDVGANIKHYRKLNNLNQQELGERIGVSNKTISSWEINRTEPRMEHFDAMCKVFGCSRSQLVSGANDIPKMSPDIAEIIDLCNRVTQEQRDAVKVLLRSFLG